MKLPNGPKTPFLLQQIQWNTNPTGYLEVAREQYGDIFATPMLMISKPTTLSIDF